MKILSNLENKFPTIKFLSPYCGYKIPIKLECLICSNKWETCGGNIARGYGCPECGLKKAKETTKWHVTQEQFLSKIPADFLSKIEILGNYIDQHCEIPVKCRICNNTWISTPYRLYRRQGCTPCGLTRKGLASRKSHDQFIQEIFDYHKDAITILGQYSTGEDRIETQCNQCGRIWHPTGRNILHRGCRDCTASLGEKEIAIFLDQYSIIYQKEYTFPDLFSPLKGRLRFDFAVIRQDQLFCLIEFDGKQHFESVEYMGGDGRFERQQINDQLKNQYCQSKGIKLIRISYKKKKQISQILSNELL